MASAGLCQRSNFFLGSGRKLEVVVALENKCNHITAVAVEHSHIKRQVNTNYLYFINWHHKTRQ